MKNNPTELDIYLSSLWPEWQHEIPDLLTRFQELHLEQDEFLPSQRGDIYFLAWGTIGKYGKKEPLRYISSGELIIIPLKPAVLQFKALIPCKVMLLPRADLYKIVELYPRSIQLYDELLSKQQESIDFRSTLLKLPKAARLEAFRARYAPVTAIINRKELAEYLKISIQYLRQHF